MISTFSTSYTLLIGDNLDCRNLKMRLKQELHSKESIVVLLVYLGCHAWAGVSKCLPW